MYEVSLKEKMEVGLGYSFGMILGIIVTLIFLPIFVISFIALRR